MSRSFFAAYASMCQLYRRYIDASTVKPHWMVQRALQTNQMTMYIKVVKNNTNKQINKFNLFTKNDGKKRSFSKNIPSNAEVIERDRIKFKSKFFIVDIYINRLKRLLWRQHTSIMKSSQQTTKNKTYTEIAKEQVWSLKKKRSKQESSSSFNEEQTLTTRLCKKKSKLVLSM